MNSEEKKSLVVAATIIVSCIVALALIMNLIETGYL